MVAISYQWIKMQDVVSSWLVSRCIELLLHRLSVRARLLVKD